MYIEYSTTFLLMEALPKLVLLLKLELAIKLGIRDSKEVLLLGVYYVVHLVVLL
jgi:hypothetical protein